MITEKQSRNKLAEGRNFGFGFSILHKLRNSENFETYTAFTACKDYFNDLVYVENTKKYLSKIFGFKHELKNIFENHKENHFYLSICPLHKLNNGEYNKYDQLEKLLKENINNIIKNINNFEKLIQKNKSFTEFLKNDEIEHYGKKKTSFAVIIKVPKYWVEHPSLFSLYLLLIRIYGSVTEEKSIFELETKDVFIEADGYFLTKLKKLELIVDDFSKIYEFYDYDKLYVTKNQSASGIHSYGIMSWIANLEKNLKENEKTKRKSIKKAA